MSWQTFRKWLQFFHLWGGLALSIPFILIGISGSLLVVFSNFRELPMPAAYARGEMQSLTRIIEASQPMAPEGWRLSAVNLPTYLGMPAAVQYSALSGGNNPPTSNVYVDPVSLELLGTGARRGAGYWTRNMASLHLALLAPQYYGHRVVGWMGVALLLFCISGLILWWPRKGQWKLALGVKQGSRGFRLNRDLHGSVGFWSLIVFFVVCLSGVLLVFPQTFQSALETVLEMKTDLTPGRADPAVVATIADKDKLTADDAANLALAAVPNARLISLQLPPTPDGAHMATMVPNLYGDNAPQISVFITPGPEVLDVIDPRNYSLGKRILVWLRILHYGWGFGFIWNALVFLSGFLPLLFAITGYRMWQLKRDRRVVIPAGAVQPAE